MDRGVVQAPLADVARTLFSPFLRAALLASLSLGSMAIAAESEIGGALPGTSNAATAVGVASGEPRLHPVGAADLRGRAALRQSSLDGHPRRCDRRGARHPRVDRPAAHPRGGCSSPTLASASGCSLAVAAAPTRRQLRLQLGSHLRRDRHGAHSCSARGPRACPRATRARARPTPTGVRSARAATRPTGLHRDQPRRPRLRQDSDRRGRLRELDRAADSLRRCTRRVGRDSSQLDARRDRSSVEARPLPPRPLRYIESRPPSHTRHVWRSGNSWFPCEFRRSPLTERKQFVRAFRLGAKYGLTTCVLVAVTSPLGRVIGSHSGIAGRPRCCYAASSLRITIILAGGCLIVCAVEAQRDPPAQGIRSACAGCP